LKPFRHTVLVTGLALAFSAAPLLAQDAASQPQGSPSTQSVSGSHDPNATHMEDQVTHGQWEEFRHSAAVETIARYAHVDTETVAKIFEDLNSGILILVILAFLLKVLPKAFRKRSETLEKQLIEARAASEEASRRLSDVEGRLSNLDSEIGEIRKQTERESIEDEKRIHTLLETESERIVASAEQEIHAAQEAAQRELKRFAADLAIDRATQSIRLSPEADRLLIDGTGKDLSAYFAGQGKGGRN
jgi:F-type H+-transporting ATPase subunit b